MAKISAVSRMPACVNCPGMPWPGVGLGGAIGQRSLSTVDAKGSLNLTQMTVPQDAPAKSEIGRFATKNNA